MEIRERTFSPKAILRMALLLALFATLLVAFNRQATATEWDPHDLIWNSDFYDEATSKPTGIPWQADFDAGGVGIARVYAADEDIMLPDGSTVQHGNPPDPENGETYALCMVVENPGLNRWSVQLRQRNMYVELGQRYYMTFDAWASDPDVQLHPKLGHVEGPEYWNYNLHPPVSMVGEPEWWLGATEGGPYDINDPVYGFPFWWDPIREVPTDWTRFDKWWYNPGTQPGELSYEPAGSAPIDGSIIYLGPDAGAPDELSSGVLTDMKADQWDFAVSEYGANDTRQSTVELAFHFGSQTAATTADGAAIWQHDNPTNFVLCIDNIEFQNIGPDGYADYDPDDPEGWSPYEKEPTATPDGAPPETTSPLAWYYRPVRVNQAGYLPNSSKIAVLALANEYAGSVDFQVLDSGGSEVFSGTSYAEMTTFDPESGNHVHWLDFSGLTTEGEGYTLVVPDVDWIENTSQPFDIAGDLYNQFKYDAIKYFYINRSGTTIEDSYFGGGVHSYPSGAASTDSRLGGNAGTGAQSSGTWDRNTAHADASGSDGAIPCLPVGGDFIPDGQEEALQIPDGAWGQTQPDCSHTKDVIGGWYDAGDHGKYVVNGGVSAWTVMNQYERMIRANGSDIFGDFQIPESGDSAPDLLDEARWQMEFMLKMQIDETASMQDMVHHKIHDIVWTALARYPDEVELDRYLLAPTTAATLNLAATGAQCARLFAGVDDAFSETCWDAAERALAAAKQNPDWYAPHRDEYFSVINLGGGPYDDDYVIDDFYWATTEMYITASELGDSDAGTYASDMASYGSQVEAELANPSADGPFSFCGGSSAGSPPVARSANRVPNMIPHSGPIPHTVDCGVIGSFTWGTTSALGAISLALADLPESADAKANVAETADSYIAGMKQQGMLMPLSADAEDENGTDTSTVGDYPWGSNSFIVNNMIMMGTAHQTSGDQMYLDAMRVGIDYIFGRNSMNKCFVSDIDVDGDQLGDYVCENYLQEPHHRTFSWIYDTAKFPVAPPGWMSGGANSVNSSWDPVQMIGAGLYCNDAPSTCFQDKIDSWSTNEVTINWNAPYAWALAYLDETSDVATSGFLDGSTTPAAPTVTLADQSSTEGESVSVTPTSTGSDLMFSATGLPTGLSIDSSTGEITGSPTTAGSYSVDITVTGAGGSSTITVSWEITTTTSPLSIGTNLTQTTSIQATLLGLIALTVVAITGIVVVRANRS